MIAEAVARYGDQVLIGAGTVLDEEQARACIDAGARFIVAPIVDVPTIAVCRRAEVAVLPGALTPTEVVQAWRAGADFVKVFPCSAVGGASYIKALRAPLPQIRLVPTGGVTLGTVGEFFAAGASAVGVGRRPVRSAGDSQRTAGDAGRGGARLRVRCRSGASAEC